MGIQRTFNRRKFIGVFAGTAVLSPFIAESESDLYRDDNSRKLADDPLRPQYHLLPKAYWMNDPNGPIYWNENYHMFYQYNPFAAPILWGHAVSKDMVHWKHLPVALTPTAGGPDADSCFTGTALIKDGKVHIMYTGILNVSPDDSTIKDGAHNLRESQCLAISDDPDLRTWTKIASPVIPNPPADLQVNGFRDPSPWRQGEWWYTVIGSGISGIGGAVLLFRSKDLRTWEHMHVLASRGGPEGGRNEPVDPWETWECPEFFALGGRHVLIFSALGKGYWQCGHLDTSTMTFHAEHAGLLDYGSYYAPKTQLDKDGNRVIWGWIQETRSGKEFTSAGWAGVMSLPRMLTMSHDGRLRFAFAPQLQQLRRAEHHVRITGDENADRSSISMVQIENSCGEILLRVKRSEHPFELVLTDSPETNPQWLRVRFDPRRPDQVYVDSRPIALHMESTEEIECRIFIDSSVIELMVNGRANWTKRFYYPGPYAKATRLRWTGTTTGIRQLSIWSLAPISNDRLTS